MKIDMFAQMAGIVVGSIFIIGLLIAAIYAMRDKESRRAAESAADAWKDERDAAIARADRLNDELAEAKARITVLETKVQELASRPDMTSHEKALEAHERRSEKRTERIIVVLEQIAEKLHDEAVSSGS